MSEAVNAAVNEPIRVAVMEQLPKANVTARSPLAHSTRVVPGTIQETAGVYLWEEALRTHLAIRGNAGSADFSRGVEAATGLALPDRLQCSQSGDWSLSWIAPDEWLLIGPGKEAYAMELSLRAQLDGHYAVINLSGGQTLLRLAGPKARLVLMKSCPYDMHDRNFPVGKVVTTVLAKSQATVHRIGDEEWALVVRRSFADYVWRWLMDAGKEYDLGPRRPE